MPITPYALKYAGVHPRSFQFDREGRMLVEPGTYVPAGTEARVVASLQDYDSPRGWIDSSPHLTSARGQPSYQFYTSSTPSAVRSREQEVVADVDWEHVRTTLTSSLPPNTRFFASPQPAATLTARSLTRSVPAFAPSFHMSPGRPAHAAASHSFMPVAASPSFVPSLPASPCVRRVP